MLYFSHFVLAICFAQCLAGYPPYPVPQFVGIVQHLTKLSESEANEIRDFCDNSHDGRQPQNRIIGGEKVEGVIPYAAALVGDGEMKCGATFISQRHLVTARHCFEKLQERDVIFSVMGGGTCLDDSPECVTAGGKMDMVELYIDLVLFSEGEVKVSSDTATDFALIQLEKPIPAQFRNRIEFACLPSKDTALPAIITVNGWGMVAEIKSPHSLIPALKQINLTVEGFANEGNCHPDWLSFCANPLKLGERDANGLPRYEQMTFSGDSGSGAVRLADGRQRAVIFGLLSLDGRSYTNIHIAFVDIRKFLDDFCFHLNLCVNGAVAKMANFHPTAIYFSLNEHVHAGRSGFQTIQNVQDEQLREKCEKRRKISDFPKRIGWAAAVVDAFGEFVCAATFVTRRHLVTMRSCFTQRIIPAIQNGRFKSYQDAFFVAAGGSCLNNPQNASAGNCDPNNASDTTVQMDVGFVAWSSAHRDELLADLAIIELRREDFMPDSSKRAFPACIKPGFGSYWQSEPMLHAYAWGRESPLTPGTKRDFLRRQLKVDLWRTMHNRLFYTDTTTTTGLLPQPMTPQDQGTALVDPDNGDLAGLFLQTDPDYDMHNIIYPGAYLEDVLCIYLNRCASKRYFYSLKFLRQFDVFFQPFINASNSDFRN